MSKNIFDVTDKGVTTYEESADTFSVTTEQNVSPLINLNKQEYNSGDNNATTSVVGRKVASIPLLVWADWMKETNGAIQNDPKLLAKYLNDPDNKAWRTHNSRI